MSAELKVVAYGYENTRPTGEKHALMMVKLDNASDQYPELATPLVRLSDAEAEIAALKEDAERMDWLMQHTVNVRVHLRYGSRNLFWAGPEEDDGEILPSDLRNRIDSARAAGDVEGRP